MLPRRELRADRSCALPRRPAFCLPAAVGRHHGGRRRSGPLRGTFKAVLPSAGGGETSRAARNCDRPSRSLGSRLPRRLFARRGGRCRSMDSRIVSRECDDKCIRCRPQTAEIMTGRMTCRPGESRPSPMLRPARDGGPGGAGCRTAPAIALNLKGDRSGDGCSAASHAAAAGEGEVTKALWLATLSRALVGRASNAMACEEPPLECDRCVTAHQRIARRPHPGTGALKGEGRVR